MKRIFYKFIFLAILIILAVLFSIPSITRNLPPWWGSILPRDGMRLGLDLQGGMHLILKVDLVRGLQNHLEVVSEDLKEMLKRAEVPFKKIEYVGYNHLDIELTDPGDKTRVEKIVEDEFPPISSPLTRPRDRRGWAWSWD
jgi:preprotein translocase subunit SecD